MPKSLHSWMPFTLLAWIENGRKKTVEEIARDATDFVNGKRRANARY